MELGKKWTYDKQMNQVTWLDDGNCRIVCAIPYGSTPEQIEEFGHLIAAAPELLRVAERIGELATIETPKELIEMADKAIEKAEGKET